MSDIRGSQIHFEAVGKHYNRLKVVDDFSVDIARGEFFSLLGPSGSGKTTTLMMLAGFTDVSEGKIFVDGVDVSRKEPRDRGFGMVFQNYAIFPHMNVFENVAFPLRARKLPRADVDKKVQAALRAVQMEHLAQRYAKQLSGGQQQRVAIARAISFEPGVVLMDEPLGALDKNLRYAMQVEIKELQQRLGLTVIYVTHDQEEAMNMSDRIAIMNDGRVAQIGPPLDVYEHPDSRFVARFLGEANVIEGDIFRTESGVQGIDHAGLQLAVSDGAEAQAGGPGAFFIRPERIQISSGSPVSGLCSIPGTTKSMSFLGNFTRYAVTCGDNADFVVDCPNADDSRFANGQPIFLNWNPDHARILTK